VSVAGAVPRGAPRPAGARPPRRLLLLSESAGLAAVLTRLLERSDRLIRSGWSREMVESGTLAAADLVVLDVPRAGRAVTLQQLRGHYRGPLVVLVERGARGLRADKGCTLLARPFSTGDLKAALDAAEFGATRPTAISPPPPAAAGAPATLAGKAPTLVAPPAGTGGMAAAFPAAGEERAARRVGVAVAGAAAATPAPPRPGAPPGAVPPATPRRPEGLLAGLVHGWRASRTVRIAGFVGLAAIAFVVAFALAAKGRCGPGCDPLTGLAPVTTLPAAAVGAPGTPTTVGRLPPSTTTATPSSGPAGAPVGVPGSTTSTTTRRATTTNRGSVTTRSTTTRSTTTTSTSTTTSSTTTTTTIAPP
jgi:hypothetical protein